jgi:hypothetical protein
LQISCSKEEKQHVEPFIQANIPGLYRPVISHWQQYDGNGNTIYEEESYTHVKVDYAGGNKVNLEFVTTAPYPTIKPCTVTLRKDSFYMTNVYYQFKQTVDSSATSISRIQGQFDVSTFSYDRTIRLSLLYLQMKKTNGQHPDGVHLECSVSK